MINQLVGRTFEVDFML